MTDDTLLNTLGTLARQMDTPTDPVYDKLVNGELSPQQVADLEEEIARDEQARVTYEAYRPLGSHARTNITQRLLAELSSEQPGVSKDDNHQVVRTSYTRRVLDFLKNRFVISGGLIAAAAVVMLFVRDTPSPSLPNYIVSVNGGEQRFRSGVADADSHFPAKSPQTFHSSSTIEVVVRPIHSVATPIVGSVFVQQQGRVRPVAVPLQISSDGAVRLHGRIDRVFGHIVGTVQLHLLIGRAPLPTIETALEAQGAAENSWQLLTTDVHITPTPLSAP